MPDHRGTGRSGRTTTGHETEVLAADIEAIVRDLDLGDLAIVGHSTGGAIAQRMLLRSRVAIERAVLSATLATPDAHFRLLFGMRLAVLESAGPEASATLAHVLGYTPEWLSDHAEEVRAAASRTADAENAEIAVARLRMLLAYDGAGDVSSIDVPVLVLGSEADIIHPAYHQRALAATIPGARLKMFPGRHFFPRSHPDLFAEALSEFFAG